MNVTEKTGKVVAALAVKETDELMLMTNKGQSVRIRCGGEKGIRETGRNAQGVKLMDLREGEVIQDVALVAQDDALDVEENPLATSESAASPADPESSAE
jgi:DNA gyrase subunit A